MSEERESLKLSQAAQMLLDECRMVLPGVQAIFGFQLIAVFNQRFSEDLSQGQQLIHLGAIALVALAAAIIMTPAAYHRRREERCVTAEFVHLSTRLLLSGMVTLMLGLCLDFFLIACLIVPDEARLPWVATLALAAAMAFLWFLFPYLKAAPRTMS